MDLVNGFIDSLYTSLGIASNYSVIVNLHTLQNTTAQALPACCVFTNPSLATASNGGDSSVSRA
jgi:hypothetical protein